MEQKSEQKKKYFISPENGTINETGNITDRWLHYRSFKLLINKWLSQTKSVSNTSSDDMLLYQSYYRIDWKRMIAREI